MSIVELMDERGPMERRPLRVDQVVKEWSVGETYQATIKFTLVEMDIGGMTLDVTFFKPDDAESSEPEDEDQDKGPMQVVPAPS